MLSFDVPLLLNEGNDGGGGGGGDNNDDYDDDDDDDDDDEDDYDNADNADNEDTWLHCIKRYWPPMWGIHLLPVDSCKRGEWCRTLMVYLVSARKSIWTNSQVVGKKRNLNAYVTSVWWPFTYYP